MLGDAIREKRMQKSEAEGEKERILILMDGRIKQEQGGREPTKYNIYENSWNFSRIFAQKMRGKCVKRSCESEIREQKQEMFGILRRQQTKMKEK
jgi:hypothetical protein